jgi:flagellar motor switch protein FliN/FliY
MGEPGTPVPDQQPGDSPHDEALAEPVHSQPEADLGGDQQPDEKVAEPVAEDQGRPPDQPERDRPAIETETRSPGINAGTQGLESNHDVSTDQPLTDLGPVKGQSTEAPIAAVKNTIDQSELDALAASAEGQAARDRIRPAGAAPGRGGDGRPGEDAAQPALDLSPGIDAGAPDHADDPIMRAMAAIEAETAAQGSVVATDGADQEGRTGPSVVGATPVAVSAEDAAQFAPPELSASQAPEGTSIDMLDDVELEVKIELGRTNMYIEDVLKLGPGSVVELDKLAGDPVDIYVNERLIARGEVLVLNDNFCVRINSIHSPVPELDHG